MMLHSNKGDWVGSIEQAIEAVFQDCQYVAIAGSGGTLQLGVHRARLRIRFIRSDGAVLHTMHVSDRKKNRIAVLRFCSGKFTGFSETFQIQ